MKFKIEETQNLYIYFKIFVIFIVNIFILKTLKKSQNIYYTH